MRIALIVAAVGVCLSFSVSAQQNAAENVCARAPADKKAQCMKFMETCRWDEGKSAYVNKKDGKACGSTPAAVPTKEQVRAEREKFLANNKWDEGKTAWIPLDKPREVCADKACEKTRDDVKKDAAEFNKTYKWDEGKSRYVPK